MLRRTSIQLEDEIVHCREERMKNGKEYRQSIRQQLLDLLEKAYLGDEERAMLDDLDSRKTRPFDSSLVSIFLRG